MRTQRAVFQVGGATPPPTQIREIAMNSTPIYRGMDRAALDAAYDNSAAVSESLALLADFQARSQHLDLRYEPAERNRIDYFAAQSPGPVLVFIHGGYWQMRAKENFSFLATGPLAHGIHVAFVGYTLAPETPLDGIVTEVRAAIAWLAERDADERYMLSSPPKYGQSASWLTWWVAPGEVSRFLREVSPA